VAIQNISLVGKYLVSSRFLQNFVALKVLKITKVKTEKRKV